MNDVCVCLCYSLKRVYSAVSMLLHKYCRQVKCTAVYVAGLFWMRQVPARMVVLP